MEVVVTTCDKCGHEAPPDDIALTVNGKAYVLNLCDPHALTFRARIGPWVDIAQLQRPRPRAPKPRASAARGAPSVPAAA